MYRLHSLAAAAIVVAMFVGVPLAFFVGVLLVTRPLLGVVADLAHTGPSTVPAATVNTLGWTAALTAFVLVLRAASPSPRADRRRASAAVRAGSDRSVPMRRSRTVRPLG